MVVPETANGFTARVSVLQSLEESKDVSSIPSRSQRTVAYATDQE